MELRHLRYFLAVARTLNFTKAAQLLHIAQPPLSRQIQQLEQMLGVTLLERSRPPRLTDAGRYFMEQSSALLEQLEKISENTRRIGLGQKTWLGIGFAPSTLYGVLPDLIRRLRGDQSLNVELNLTEMTTVQQVEALKKGRIDIGFGRIHIQDPAITQWVLTEDRLIAALPTGHPLAGRAVQLSELAAEPLILYPANPRPSYADHIIALFDAVHLPFKVAQWTNELQTALGLVGAGIGITLVPASVQIMHREDITFSALIDANATSPIIVSQRVGDRSVGLQRCTAIIEELLGVSPLTAQA